MESAGGGAVVNGGNVDGQKTEKRPGEAMGETVRWWVKAEAFDVVEWGEGDDGREPAYRNLLVARAGNGF